jgi:transposase
MARTATGSEVLEQAQQALHEAKTVEELRQAQAVVLPLLLGLSIEQTAAALGVSVGWACQLRRRFIVAGHLVRRTRPAQGPRAYLSRVEEEALLEPFVERARQGQIVVAAEIRAALEQRLGKRTAPSTVYNLLRRHGWRKLAPDRVHPQGNPPAQRRWKKKVAAKTG